MASTFYKYAERDADSQVNWAEVGKGLSDMLSETNRVRQEKKDALDAAQRESMKYLAETPNGEHVGARQSILEYSNMASNQLRIMKRLMEQGQLDVKEYTIFRQNLTDNTNLAFNANKAYQENYADVMSGVRDKTYSQLTADNYAEAEGFGNWKNIGWQIAPNGVVMAGKMIEQEVDGKKVRTLDKTPEGLRSMDYLNQAILSKIPFYKYEDKVDSWVDTLGKNIEASTLLGKIGAQGLSRSLEDVTKKKYAKEGDMQAEYTFIQSENDFIDTVVGLPVDAARVLVDSAIFAPNNKQYRITTSEKDAKDNSEAILKVVDPDSGGVKYVISKEQQKQANEFIRTQMRAKYDKIEKEDVVGQVSRDEESEGARKAREEKKEKDNALGTWGDVFKATTPAGKQAALETILGSKLAQDRGLLDIDTTSQPGKITFKYADPVKNRTLDYDPNTITLRQWNELGNEVHGIDNVAEVMKRNKGGDPNMRMGAQQRNFTGVKAGRTPVKDPVVEFNNKLSKIENISVKKANGKQGKGMAFLKDKSAATALTKVLEGTGITIDPNWGIRDQVYLKSGDKEYTFKVGYDLEDPDEVKEAQESMYNLSEWIEANTSAEKKKEMLSKGLIGNEGPTGTIQGGRTR
jgi:hypothetical protein